MRPYDESVINITEPGKRPMACPAKCRLLKALCEEGSDNRRQWQTHIHAICLVTKLAAEAKYEVRTWQITFLLKMSTLDFFSDGLVSFSDDCTKRSDYLFPDYFDGWSGYSGTENYPSNGASKRLCNSVIFYARIHS
jgi:hypothetical protein